MPVNPIPTPPIVEDQDPLLTILRKHLDGPFVKLYYDMAQEIRQNGPDLYEPGDNLKRKMWSDSLRRAVKVHMLEGKEQE